MSLATQVHGLKSKVQTPEGQLTNLEEDEMSPVEREILERVLTLSLQESRGKGEKKQKSLSLKYRKLIANMKMTKSSQKCTVCYSCFCEGEIIKRFPCKHIFHRECAKSWLKVDRNCPNCRFDLEQHFEKLEREGRGQNGVEECKQKTCRRTN